MIVEKINIIIDKQIFQECNLSDDGDNINGPSIIKVPDFIKNPLGKYYCYFADHGGKYIRMAYSNQITGPYKLYKNGVLHLDNIPGFNHLASPDVHIEEKKLCMYYHCPYKNGKTSQSTFCSYSNDGLTFISDNINIIHPYFRKFNYKNNLYGLAMKTVDCNTISYQMKEEGCLSVTVIMKQINNTWKEVCEILPWSRHTCILTINNKNYIFFSSVNDIPEHIKMGELLIDEKNNTYNIINIKSIIKPELFYENHNEPLNKSKYGSSSDFVRQLRDPYVIKDNEEFYILYTVCGEKGIAIGKLNLQFLS